MTAKIIAPKNTKHKPITNTAMVSMNAKIKLDIIFIVEEEYQVIIFRQALVGHIFSSTIQTVFFITTLFFILILIVLIFHRNPSQVHDFIHRGN